MAGTPAPRMLRKLHQGHGPPRAPDRPGGALAHGTGRKHPANPS